MIERRRFLEQIEQRLGWSPVVALLGARQVGKTTLARQFVGGRDAHYFDLESSATQELMQEPATRGGAAVIRGRIWRGAMPRPGNGRRIWSGR